ncbi:MAG: metallophosphoesterase family protein [Gemmatimonadetes bacterium]|nr:metallophosphoesterase family protein [Gemmatimonadota bacterium]MBI3567109.1 metallophosphoesterase family protein [Gemmatimonadota bacterium]
MTIALIGDVHANLPALEAVLAALDARDDVEATYHVGDLVGYAPWPDETVALLRSRGIAGVSGNYDSSVATGYKHCGCQYEDPRQEALSHRSFEWTKANTSAETRRRLGELPFSLTVRPLGGHLAGPQLMIVHGTPTLNTVYWHADRSDDFCRQMAALAGLRAGDVIAFGHTHKPWHRVVDGMHFVNCGSAGRPKDGDWRTGFVTVTFSAAGPEVGFHRLDYDIDRAARGIEASTLPHEFAGYLRTGGTLPPDTSAPPSSNAP